MYDFLQMLDMYFWSRNKFYYRTGHITISNIVNELYESYKR
jgi:hypothetical protein